MSKYHSVNDGLLTISIGNSKLGHTANIATRPGIDCVNCSECIKDCYAKKAYLQYPGVRDAWTRNGLAFRSEDHFPLYDALAGYLNKYQPRFFRIHVAGDFLSQFNVDLWAQLATDYPDTKFLAFTKAFDFDYSQVPSNLQIVFSMWIGMEDTAPNGPRAWLQDGTETRIPSNALECAGHCEGCNMCWHLSEIDRDVYFIIH